VFDFDATLVNSYSEKQDATPTYKKGFGFFPLGVWALEDSNLRPQPCETDTGGLTG
jgi:hypothetical protein